MGFRGTEGVGHSGSEPRGWEIPGRGLQCPHPLPPPRDYVLLPTGTFSPSVVFEWKGGREGGGALLRHSSAGRRSTVVLSLEFDS